RMPEAPAHHHPVASPQTVVTGRAVNIEPLFAAQKDLFRDWKRERIHILSVGVLAGIERGVCVQVATGDGPDRKRTGGAAIIEECAGPQRNVLWLIVHILPTAHRERQKAHDDTEPRP